MWWEPLEDHEVRIRREGRRWRLEGKGACEK